jgi:hypothetical protein
VREPAIEQVLQRRGIEVVERVPTLVAGADQAGRHEQVEVLGDGLPGRAKLMLGRQPCAQLEQRLPIAVGELVKDRPSGGIGQRFEDVAHRRPP